MAVDPTVPIGNLGSGPAPFDYTVPASQSFSLLAIRATFDGTLAAGAFLPCIQIVTAGSTVIMQTVGESVAAGGSADVTFAPFLEQPGTAGSGGIRFDTDNEGGWLDVTANDTDPGGFGIKLDDNSGTRGMLIQAEESILIRNRHGSPSITVDDTFSGITIATGANELRLTGTGVDAGGQQITNGADGAAPTDFATVEQLPTGADFVSSLSKSGGTLLVGDVTLSEGANITLTEVGQDIQIAATGGGGGIDFDTANTGDWLDVTTTGADGDGFGIHLHDTDGTGPGILIDSDAGNITIAVASGELAALTSGGGTQVGAQAGFGAYAQLQAGEAFTVLNHLGAPILQMVEGSPDLHIPAGGVVVADL